MFNEVVGWLNRERTIKSAVLFGSSALVEADDASRGRYHDFDLHVIASRPLDLERIDWVSAVPNCGFRLQCVRPATGGVRKVTAVFGAGEIDLVIVPLVSARLVRFLVATRLYRRHRGAMIALNEMATALRAGYRFIKGEKNWGDFYADVVRKLPGVRLSNAEIRQLADAFVIDYWWVLRKAERGELRAAQHVLHRNLSDLNLRLYRELRLRRAQPLPSFGLGRHLETLAAPPELAALSVNSALEPSELRAAANHVFAALRLFMAELDPTWVMPTVDFADGVINDSAKV
jgi:hypothetical protein